MIKIRVIDYVNNIYVNNSVVNKIDLEFKKYYDAVVFSTDQGDIAVKFCDVWDGELIKQREILKQVSSKIDHLQSEPWSDVDWSIDVFVSSVPGKHYYKVELKLWCTKLKFDEWTLFVNKDMSDEKEEEFQLPPFLKKLGM